MVHIETIDLTSLGITLPSNRVGMVIAQPYLSLTSIEPYQCTAPNKAQQLKVLTDTLVVALAARHGEPKTHFTVFPEYSIPGLDGIALVETALHQDDWPTGTIVIGGTDALSKVDFETLSAESGTHLDTIHNGLDRIGQNEWINCGITWVKGSDGSVERWLQPKLRPAGLEQDVQYQAMFRGNSVFTFKGPFDNDTLYHFCTLVCFDWIAAHDNKKAWHLVLDALKQQVAPGELSLSWFFVIQRNPIPSHDTFLTEVRGFFDQTVVPNVHRDRTCLVFANGAGKAFPGRADKYGGTSLIFSLQTPFDTPTCSSTFSNGGVRFRSSRLLSAFRDIYFREHGACIHSFAQINPGSLVAGAAGRMFAVENAYEFPFFNENDPRVPSAPVPASVKWLNDELDQLPRLSARNQRAVLATQSDDVHQRIVTALREISPQSISNMVKLAASESEAKHADEWDRTEVDALEHLVHTLDIIGLGFAPLTVGADPAHATVVIDNQTLDLIAIRGKSHEDCIEHSKRFLPLPRRKVLLISQDRDNNSWSPRFDSFLRMPNLLLSQERNITDTASGTLHLGYRKLLDIFQQSTTVAAVQGAINAELNE
jgi:hypothetical protein